MQYVGQQYGECFPFDHANKSFIAFTDDNYDSLQLEDHDEDGRDSNPHPKKALVALIPRHEEFGWPLIPCQGDKDLKESKSVIHAYVTTVYYKAIPFFLPFCIKPKYVSCDFTNNNVALVPWVTLSADFNFQYISSESLPQGQVLQDPSKLQLLQIRQIWRYWSQRQDSDTQGLVFLKASERDVREADSSAGPSKDQSYTYVKPANLSLMDEKDLDGLETCAHLESPAANAENKATKMTFLSTLFDHPIYTRTVDLLSS